MKIQIRRGLRIPMRDGVTLAADLYRPAGAGQHPAIIVRTPYLINTDVIHETASYYAGQGFAVLYVEVRGRGDSDGVFVPYRNEAVDGYDTIEWAAAQDWCSGAVGTMGGSYLGRIQWQTALLQPPSLKAMSVAVTPSDPFVEWPTGIPTPQHLCWLYMTSGRLMQNVDVVDWDSIYPHLPLATMDELTGRDLPHWREELRHQGLDDWWKEICYQHRLEEIDLPVLHISGWYDDEQVGTPLNFAGMTQRAKTERARRSQKMIMGPWPHRINASTTLGELDFGPDSLIDLHGYQVRFFNHWLKGEANGLNEEAPVQLFVMGENKWREEQEFPLARTEWTKFYLHSQNGANSRFGDGRLSREAPRAGDGGAPVDTYLYDPADPVPYLTEPTSAQIGGPDDYSQVEERRDVLVYSTGVLTEEVEVTGPVKMELFAASSAVDTDFMVKLLDVWPNGYAQRLTDGMVRARFRDGMETMSPIEPGRVYRYEVDCWNTSHLFKKGHQIRIEIASSAFPKYDRNLNTGAPLGQTAEMVTAEQTICHSAEHPSAIILPVIPR